ncbi:glycosyltransferase family 4 protein [Fervidibacillus albus]|uniref:Glycosyltransferase family 4 protein n=1 Tax=Fervidibacillus albus TaxID=2980026 RepID=A0A9E8RWP7_9BACI|nr:glycosyltransferase family 4 protein [Fervidibacillus albus]WAA08642.1 glycosyltransferase family 4 protein [Fervidibacillus albus]
MRILVIWRLLTVGGVNAGWRNRAIQFRKYGVETDFLYMKDLGGMHMMEDVATVYLTNEKKEIVRIIEKNDYDAIIVVDTASAYKWIQKAKYNGPVLIEARTPELKKLTRHLKSYEQVQPVGIIVPSEYQKRLVSILTDEIPIYPIDNGIDSSFFRPLLKNEIRYDESPYLQEGKKVIGWIGRLDQRKNWQQLLEIAKGMKERRDDVEFWVIGGAKSVQREQFAEQRRSEQLEDIIRWYPVIPYQHMPHVYAKIRLSGGCTLSTTKTESFGNTFIESMACGVPVVTSDMMPMSEIVLNGKTGLLFQQNKTNDAIHKLNVLLDDEQLHQNLSKAGITYVQNRFSIDIVAKRYIQLLKRLMQQHANERKGKGYGTDSL